MPERPTLLFLHGVGKGDPDGAWRVALSGALVRLGYPAIGADAFVAPRYAHLLNGTDDADRVPPITSKPLRREDARRNRREFEGRTAAMEFRIGQNDLGTGYDQAEAVIGAATELPQFKQARNYLEHDDIRASVLVRVLKALPETGRLLILGHSLGSVVAADIVRRLPPAIEVVGMVTIGSPLASRRFSIDDLTNAMDEPPTNLGWWVNFWNRLDPVASHRGLSSVFPWLLDHQVVTAANVHVHDAVEYLSDPAVATAIGFGLFGSHSQELVPAARGVDTPVDETELLGLLALRYTTHLRNGLDGDDRERFEGALRHVQSTVAQGMLTRRAAEGRPAPARITELTFDLADVHAAVPEPPVVTLRDRSAAVVPLIVLASGNVLRPFEIDVSKKVRQQAMRDLAAESGLGSPFGDLVLEATTTAQNVLNPGRGAAWWKLGAIGVGAAALVVATGGLALAAAPGVVGAAAVTSALAAFGPGGMIGGLVTAGSLIAAGGGGIAVGSSSLAAGLASPDTSAEALESIVTRQLTAVVLRQEAGLEQDPAVWRALAETERQVRREHERLDEFSDPSAPSLKELQRKILAIERALEYMRKHGLDPVN